MKRFIISADYSITSPALTFLSRNENKLFISAFSFEDVEIFTSFGEFRDVKIKLMRYPTFDSQFERFRKLAESLVSVIENDDVNDETCDVIIEGYSFASKGRITSLAEALQSFLFVLFLRFGIQRDPRKVSPSTLKKFATGNGRADKEMMIKSFEERFQVDLMNLFQPLIKKKGKTVIPPISDIVDSMFLLKFHMEMSDEQREAD